MNKTPANNNPAIKISGMILVPFVFLLILAFAVLAYFNYQTRLNSFENEADKVLERFLRVANTEKYICENLIQIFDDSHETKGLKNELIRFFQRHNFDAEYVIWEANGVVSHCTSSSTAIFYREFPETHNNLLAFNGRIMLRDSRELDSKVKQLKKAFGPLFDPYYYSKCYEGKNLHLIRTDSSGSSPFLWIKASKNFSLAVRIAPETVKANIGLKRIVSSMENNEIIAGFRRGNEIGVSGSVSEKLIQSWLDNALSGKRIHSGYYFHTIYIDSQTSAICAISSNKIGFFVFDRRQKLLAILMFFCLLIVYALNSMLVRRQQKYGLSVKAQMLLLFLVANLLTGTIIGLVVKDYFKSLRKSLHNKAVEQMLKKLQDADDLFENEYTFQKRLIESELAKLKFKLKRFGIKHEAIKSFIEAQSPSPPYRMYLIGSSTPVLASEDALITATATLSIFTDEVEKHPYVLQQLRRMLKIGKYYLNLLNRRKLDPKISVEVETMVEALSRQTPIEQMLEFFEHDKKFWHWGFGNRNFPAYIETFSVNDPEEFDYVLLYLWGERILQCHFLARSINLFNRAESDIKLLAVDDFFSESYPSDFFNADQLIKMSRLIQRSSKNEKMVEIAGQENIVVHYKGEKLNKFFWIALFPVDKIDSSIDSQKSLIFQFGFLCLAFSVFLGVWLANLILEPLNELGRGNDALQKRHFSYRIPALGNDEFGIMANHLNSTLIDFEELQAASMVKGKLLDCMEQAFDIGANSIFVKTFSGHHNHFLAIDSDATDNLEILVAVPESSGVVASLVQAFIRAALIHFEHLKMLPVERLNKIFELLRKSSRSRKNGLSVCLDIVIRSEKESISFCQKGITVIRFDFEKKPVVLKGIPTGNQIDEQFCLEKIVPKPGEILLFSTHQIFQTEAVINMVAEICKRNLSLPETADLVWQSISEYPNVIEMNSDLTMLFLLNNQASR